MQLCLGTVQFGLDYGIFNQKKKDPKYCVQCLDYATQNGIMALDTATAYGTAEQVVGEFLKKKIVSRDKLFVSTKFLPNLLDDCNGNEYAAVIRNNLIKSLSTLHLDYIDAYFLHSARYAFRPEILEALYEVKKEGLAKSVGVSVYETDEAEACFQSKYVDYIQAPYSLFDHRMKEKGVFDNKQTKCKIDTRTAFVKGLVRLQENEVPDYLAKAKPLVAKLEQICQQTGYSRAELAIGYVKRESAISHLVFGIRDMEQLKQDIAAFAKDIPEDVFAYIDKEFVDTPRDVVIPSLWKK